MQARQELETMASVPSSSPSVLQLADNPGGVDLLVLDVEHLGLSVAVFMFAFRLVLWAAEGRGF